MEENNIFSPADILNKNTNLLILASNQQESRIASVKKSSLLTISYDYFIKVFRQFELLSEQCKKETRDVSVQTDITEKSEFSTQTSLRFLTKTNPPFKSYNNLNKNTISITSGEKSEMRQENPNWLTNKIYNHNKNRSLFKPYKKKSVSVNKNNMSSSHNIKYYQSNMYQQLQEKRFTNQRRSSSNFISSPISFSPYGINGKRNVKSCRKDIISKGCFEDQRSTYQEQQQPIDLSICKTSFQANSKVNNTTYIINSQKQIHNPRKIDTIQRINSTDLTLEGIKNNCSKSLKKSILQRGCCSQNLRHLMPKDYTLNVNQFIAASLERKQKLFTKINCLKTSQRFNKLHQKHFVLDKELITKVIDLTDHK